MKKLVSFLLVFALLLTVAPAYTYATETGDQQDELFLEYDFVSQDPMFAQSTVVEIMEQEPNDSPQYANRIENHYLVSGTIGRTDEIDVYTLELEKASTIYIAAAAQSRNMDFAVRDGVKYFAQGTVNSMRNGVYFGELTVFLPAGTYYLEFTSGNNSAFAYAFQFESLSEEDDKNLVFRVFGSTRYDTSIGIADQVLLEWQAQTEMTQFKAVVVASGTNFADALAGSCLAARMQAPILLTNGYNDGVIRQYIQYNLEPGGTVYMLGGTSAVPTNLEAGMNGFVVKRLGGATRYETNLAILEEAGVSGQSILVCTGTGFADSLSASATGLPILLVKDSLTPAQKEMLSRGNGQIYIIGGTSAVSKAVENELKLYGNVTRIGGNTRYDTSVKVAQTFFGDEPFAAVLAYAQNFPDGLCGGPLAYSLKAPLILTATGKESAAVNYVKSVGIQNGYVLGGTGLISDNTTRKIFGLSSDYQIVAQ